MKYLKNRKGMSFIDGLFAVVVFAIVGNIVLGLYANMNRVYQEGTDQANLQRKTELLLNIMAKDIREAEEVQSCSNCGPDDDATGIRITTLPNPAVKDVIEYYLVSKGSRWDIRKQVNTGAEVDLSDFEAEKIDVNTPVFEVTSAQQEVLIRFNLKDKDTDSNGTAINTRVRWRN